MESLEEITQKGSLDGYEDSELEENNRNDNLEELELSTISPERDPHDSAVLFELRERISKSLDRLTHRERAVLKLRFGLEGNNVYGGCNQYGENHTLKKIGGKIRRTREAIRQIEAKALEKLGTPQCALNLIGFYDGCTGNDEEDLLLVRKLAAKRR
jgi:RNA polymerase primary sigma factor